MLVHVTANAEWSNLPLSGLFVQMMERLVEALRPGAPSQALSDLDAELLGIDGLIGELGLFGGPVPLPTILRSCGLTWHS